MNVGVLLGLLPALLGPGGPTPQAGGEVQLTFKPYRTWQIELPQPQQAKVGASFALKATLGSDFAVVSQGTGIAVDTDGDGQTDVTVEGEEGFVVLRGKGQDGAPLSYAAHLKNQGGWSFRAGGAMVGKLGETRIQLIDQDNNGSYADFGVDAMVVGRGETACFLSKAIVVDDQVYQIEVSADGTRIRYEPWSGPVGTLDLTGIVTKGRLLSAVVVSKDGSLSFDLANAPRKVPAGEYRLHGGKVGLGEAEVRVRQGRAPAIAVAPEATTKHSWGGPTQAEFAYQRKGEQVVISPGDVWYYGDAGEEYFGWNPVGKSPVFSILEDGKDGKELAQAIFPGSC